MKNSLESQGVHFDVSKVGVLQVAAVLNALLVMTVFLQGGFLVSPLPLISHGQQVVSSWSIQPPAPRSG